MAVDIKLNEMVDDLARLEKISIDDVELSYRTRSTLYFLNANNMAQAFDVLHNGKFGKYKGIGRKAVGELREVLANITEITRPDPTLLALRTKLHEAQTELSKALGNNDYLESRLTGLRVSFGEVLEKEREKTAHVTQKMNNLLERLVRKLSVAQLIDLGIRVNIDVNTEDEKEA